MSAEDGPELVRRWWDDVWGAGDLDAIDEIFADPITRHTSMGTEHLSRASYKKRVAELSRVLRGAVTTIDDQVVAGDKVWSRATSRGANLTTEDASVITWMVVSRIQDGRIAETWSATVPGVEWER